MEVHPIRPVDPPCQSPPGLRGGQTVPQYLPAHLAMVQSRWRGGERAASSTQDNPPCYFPLVSLVHRLSVVPFAVVSSVAPCTQNMLPGALARGDCARMRGEHLRLSLSQPFRDPVSRSHRSTRFPCRSAQPGRRSGFPSQFSIASSENPGRSSLYFCLSSL